MAFPLPDKPSIAVLPFVNMSEDSKQEYFSDGITEDLITDLSKISGLFVIARNSSFVYKGRSVKVREVAEELGVRYVLEGSVRRAGDQVRINAQLIDATTGGHVWAERYDGSLADVFALQDRVTRQIVSALAVNLTARERTLQAQSETRIPEAYDAFLRGWAHYRRNTPEGFAEAVPYFERAITLDPNYGRAHAALSAIYWASIAKTDTSRGSLWLGLGTEGLQLQANRYLQNAQEDPVPLTHQVVSSVRSFQGRHEEAIAEAEQAIELDANDPIGYESLATALIYAGRPAEGAEAIRRAMRLDPHYPSEYLVWLGLAQFGEGKFKQAAESFEAAIQRNPDNANALIVLVASYGHLGRSEDARSAKSVLNDLRAKRAKRLEEARAEGIEIGIDVFLAGPYTLKDVDLWPFKKRADRERLRVGLEKAGVPAVADSSAESLREVAGATTVDAIAARALFDRGATFVDVRTRNRWDTGHPPGAILLDLKKDFNETNLSAVVGKDQEVVIYCQGPKCLRASRACAEAVSWGFTNVYYFRDGFPGWKAAGNPVATQ
jgi:TolB-like protein/rhodanese-related sulfurtransferase